MGKRMIKLNEAFDWVEYDTNEKLLPYKKIDYNGEISTINMYHDDKNLNFILNFVIREEENNQEKILVSFAQSNVLSVRKMELFMSLDNFIEEDEKAVLNYKFENPQYIGWYLKEYHNTDIFVILDGMYKYEIVTKKDSQPIISQLKTKLRNKENKIKKLKFNFENYMRNIEIKKDYTMKLTKEKFVENIFSIYEIREEVLVIDINNKNNLQIKVKINNKKYFIIEYESDKIWNYQYIKIKNADIVKFYSKKYEKEKFYFMETQNSKFAKYSDYDIISFDKDDNQISHKYIFKNMLLEILVENDYYPDVYLENRNFSIKKVK